MGYAVLCCAVLCCVVLCVLLWLLLLCSALLLLLLLFGFPLPHVHVHVLVMCCWCTWSKPHTSLASCDSQGNVRDLVSKKLPSRAKSVPEELQKDLQQQARHGAMEELKLFVKVNDLTLIPRTGDRLREELARLGAGCVAALHALGNAGDRCAGNGGGDGLDSLREKLAEFIASIPDESKLGAMKDEHGLALLVAASADVDAAKANKVAAEAKG